jgi:galactoside 2-L-fucosyltransferase 1/2
MFTVIVLSINSMMLISIISVYHLGQQLQVMPSTPTSGPVHRNPVDGKTGRYVVGRNDGRLGNQLFLFAATLFVAQQTGREAAISDMSKDFDSWFLTESVPRIRPNDTELCPCVRIAGNRPLAFDQSVADLNATHPSIAGRNIVIIGYFQSWIYVAAVEDRLRRYLQPTKFAIHSIGRFFDDVRPRRWRPTADRADKMTELTDYRRIGIHVRVGDTFSASFYKIGFTVPGRPYFRQALRRVLSEEDNRRHDADREFVADHRTDGIRRVQFLVATDDIEWVRDKLNLSSLVAEIVNESSSRTPSGGAELDADVSYSIGHQPAFDMLMLSMCDAVVMTTGTFGWWSAWLANRTTIYFSNWPRKGSPLESQFNRRDYFPPNWIGIGGPHVNF